MQPGDIVSLYATAKDARNETRTDMFFVQAEPFEKTYRQADAADMAGGGGGGGEFGDGEISKRQKDIIAATFNEIRSKDKAKAVENAKFLSEVQSKLRDQAKSMAERTQARRLDNTNEEFKNFVKDLESAVEEMGKAADKLKGQQWNDALTPEQKALQHILRAEATMRDIQVAFGNRGQRGGGGGGGAARDLANLFDLELDREKNQYETGQQQASSEQRQREIDEALQKLEQLARRQQELAEQQRKQNQQQSFEQRWQQEMLRREAEQLQRQMEQMSQQGNSSQQQQSSQQGQQSSQSSGQLSRNQQGQQSGRQGQVADPRLQQALERLQRATEDMRKAQQNQQNQQGQNQQPDPNARRAADRLSEAKDILSGMQRQDVSDKVGDLARRSDKLARDQREFANRLKQAYGDNMNPDPRMPRQGLGGQQERQQAEQLAKEEEQRMKELEQLEKDLQKTSRDMAGTQPKASQKLREALAESQQNELAMRMKFNANGIRQGYGNYIPPREVPIVMGLDRMRSSIREAQEALGGEKQQQAGKESLEDTLARVERLRNQVQALQRQSQRGQDRNGQQQAGQQQSGQQQGGQQQGGQQQGGQQQGGQQQGGQQQGGQQAGQQPNGGNRGGDNSQPRPFRGGNVGGPNDNWRGGYVGNDYQLPDRPPEAISRDIARDLGGLRQALAQNPDLAREAAEMLREIQKLTMGQTQGPELDERIRRQVLPNIEQLELQLRQKLDAQGSGQVRSGTPDVVPPGYGDAVAEYFRKLSKTAPKQQQ
jgi:hypothetical protein